MATDTPTTIKYLVVPPPLQLQLQEQDLFGPPRSHLLYKEHLTDLHVVAPSGMTG